MTERITITKEELIEQRDRMIEMIEKSGDWDLYVSGICFAIGWLGGFIEDKEKGLE